MRRVHGGGNHGRRRRASGQALILAIMILVVILAAVLIFFDVHNAVRAKVKGQNAVDAAALAGANWQKHTLNLIGELNLIKAADVLISADALGISADPETYMKEKLPEQLADPVLLQTDLERVEAEKEKLRATLDLVTEMQTRISFVGPLIGFGAAQQAAKNNGLAANRESGKLLYDIFYKNILDDSIYGNEQIVPQVINGYSWRQPYASMIDTLLDTSENGKNVQGVAAFPRFVSLTTLDSTLHGSPFSSFLASRAFYDAVMGNNWCAVMDFLDRASQRDMSGTWWGKFECTYNTGFLKQSEILPVHVDFFEGGSPGDLADAPMKRMLEDRGIRPLGALYDKADPYPHTVSATGEVTYTGTFDSEGRPVRNEADTDLKITLPEVTWAVFDNKWSSYSDDKKTQWSQYLEGSFRPGLDYSGALSYFEAGLSMQSFSGAGMAAGAFRNLGGRGAAGRRMRNYARSAASAGNSLKSMGSSIVTSSSAKPLGKIQLESGTDLPPFGAGGLVLPVFTHSILIPISLDPPEGFSLLDVSWFYFAAEFLPILGESATLEEAKSEAERQHPDHAIHYDYFYRALQKMNDEQWRAQGLSWLNAPADYYYDEEGVQHVRSRNRDHCFDWPSGSGGGDGRWGPDILH